MQLLLSHAFLPMTPSGEWVATLPATPESMKTPTDIERKPNASTARILRFQRETESSEAVFSGPDTVEAWWRGRNGARCPYTIRGLLQPETDKSGAIDVGIGKMGPEIDGVDVY